MNMINDAMAFFDACETGKGWAACAAWCAPDAGFSCQAAKTDGINTLAAYADWMTEICHAVPDAAYEIKGVGVDEARNLVLIFGVFSSTTPGDGDKEAVPVSTEYVYSIEFDGERIAHMTKIWNDSYNR
jgi:hypothetical protein